MNILDGAQFIRRFWSKVDIKRTTECWNWQAATQSKGYGSVGVGEGKTQLTHRVAYLLEIGPIPDGLLIRHKCDNKLCVNPNHLELGTIADNARDAVTRGRTPRGDRNGNAKLMEAEVKTIRKDYGDGNLSIRDLAALYKVNDRTIGRIVKNEYWKLPLVD